METTRELRKRYLKFAARGLFTSIPFLVHHPQGKQRLASPYWKTSLDGKQYRAAIEMRYALGISQHMPLCPLGELKRQEEEDLHRQQDKRMLDAVHANVVLVDTSFKSVPTNVRLQGMITDRKKEKEDKRDKEMMA
jgi:hypothetical protein